MNSHYKISAAWLQAAGKVLVLLAVAGLMHRAEAGAFGNDFLRVTQTLNTEFLSTSSGMQEAEVVPSHELLDEPLQLSTALVIQCDSELLLPGVPCELSLQAAGLPAVQYAGLELRYDTSRLTFVRERPGSVFGEDAVTLAKHLPDGSLGVSVSSTAGEREGDGEIVHLEFVISDGAPDGHASFSAEYLEFTDSDGSPLPAPLPEAAGIDIPPYLSDAGITGPGPITIARGSELVFRFRLAASGVTADDLADPERFTAEMIVIDASAWDGSAPFPAPASFDRTVPLSYTGTSGGQLRFEAPFPPEQPVGSWRVAGLFRLDDQPELVAGYGSDDGGLWDGETFNAVEVTVTTPRVTVAEWTFDGEQWTADTGLFTNLQHDAPAEVSLFGARFSGWTTGRSGRAPNSNNWQQEVNGEEDDAGNGDNGGGDGNGNDIDDGNGNGNSNDGASVVHDKYWQARLVATGYAELTLQFQMNGSGTGPRDFRLYYNVSGEAANGDGNGDPAGESGESSGWQPVPGGEFESSTSWTLTTVTLPEETGDVPELLLRWVRIGNTSISGNEIGPTGTNRLDDIRITGVPIDTEEMLVWPGNTTGEGAVTEADVLSLALYWMSTGPERIPQRIDWSPQPVVRWVPEAAAHADTDGDGRVGYRDLLAVGRNFGQTVESGPQKIAAQTASTGTLAAKTASASLHGNASVHLANGTNEQRASPLLSKPLPRLSADEQIHLVLQTESPVPLLGISALFSLDQLPPDGWELVSFAPGNWAKEWQTRDRLIRFHHGRAPAVVQEEYAGSKHQKAKGHDRDEIGGVSFHGLTVLAGNITESPGSVAETKNSVTGTRGGVAGTRGGVAETQSSVAQTPGSISWAAAWAHAGPAAPVDADELVILTIRARTNWHTDPVIHLHRVTLSTPSGLVDRPVAEDWKLLRQDRALDAGRSTSDDIPLTTRLHANYPNPFNPSTTLSFDLHEPGEVLVSVYDVLGRRIATLMQARMDAGRHELGWDASRLASGIYIVRLETADVAQTRQVMLLK